MENSIVQLLSSILYILPYIKISTYIHSGPSVWNFHWVMGANHSNTNRNWWDIILQVIEAGDNRLVKRLKENWGFPGELYLRMEGPAHIRACNYFLTACSREAKAGDFCICPVRSDQLIFWKKTLKIHTHVCMCVCVSGWSIIPNKTGYRHRRHELFLVGIKKHNIYLL